MQTHVPRHCISARYKSSLLTQVPRRCTSVRYQSSLYTDASTSPMFTGEVSVFLICRRTHLAVEHRRDISLSYIQTHVPRRCTLARHQFSFYTDAPTSPLYIGEIPVFVIYTDAPTSPLNIGEISVFLKHRCIYLVVEHRRDISLSYIQTYVPRRCTSARYQSFLYTEAPTSPLHIGEIPVFVIYRRTYLAVEHRRDISLFYIQTHVPRR